VTALTVVATAGLLTVAVGDAVTGSDVADVPRVPAIVATTEAYGDGDVADDPAVWVDPQDPTRSVMIGSNKGEPGGLQVFDLEGEEQQFLRTGRLNNVDLRDGFPFSDGEGTLVAATDRDRGTVVLFRLHHDTRQLERLGAAPTGLPAVYGFCLYRSAALDRFYAFVTSEDGPVGQYEVRPGDPIELHPVRRWTFSSEGEGCVGDDEHAALYLTQESVGLWKVAADPEADGRFELLASTADESSPLVPDVEGVALYDAGEGAGYLVVSSQGDSTFAIYDRLPPHRYLASFAVGPGDDVDGAEETDGLDVTPVAVDERFPAGLLVVHDQHNDAATTSNFKYVSWADVQGVVGLDEPGRGAR
jgi:3-phytase